MLLFLNSLQNSWISNEVVHAISISGLTIKLIFAKGIGYLQKLITVINNDNIL